MDRDRRLAEMMGMCWHRSDYPVGHMFPKCSCGMSFNNDTRLCSHIGKRNPDFSLPEWRAKLMDFCVGQEWWNEFKDWSWDKAPDDDNDWVAYLWRNLPDLIVEYHGEGRE
jgi:hypothetical protein